MSPEPSEDYQLVLLEAYHRFKHMRFAICRPKEWDRRFDNLMALYRISRRWLAQNPDDLGAKKVAEILRGIDHMFD